MTGLAGSLITTKKGPTAQQLAAVVTFVKRRGFEQSILQCDGEPALVKLVEEIGKQTSLPTRQSPAYSQRSEEWHSSLFAQFRALLFDFCRRYKLHPSGLTLGSSLGQHMLRHAEWLLNRLQLHSSDNKTSFQRRWGIAYSNAVLPFGEFVFTQDLSLAIWLGRCESSDERILAKANSSNLVKSTCVTRLSLESSMELALFKCTSIPPPELASAAYLEMAEHGNQTIAKAGGEEQLRMEFPPQASNNQPQHKAIGQHKQKRAMSFQLSPGLAQPSSSQACSCDLLDLAWHQPALQQQHELQPTALHTPFVQQSASATTALIGQVLEPTLRRQPSAKQASQHQLVRS